MVLGVPQGFSPREFLQEIGTVSLVWTVSLDGDCSILTKDNAECKD